MSKKVINTELEIAYKKAANEVNEQIQILQRKGKKHSGGAVKIFSPSSRSTGMSSEVTYHYTRTGKCARKNLDVKQRANIRGNN